MENGFFLEGMSKRRRGMMVGRLAHLNPKLFSDGSYLDGVLNVSAVKGEQGLAIQLGDLIEMLHEVQKSNFASDNVFEPESAHAAVESQLTPALRDKILEQMIAKQLAFLK